MEKRVAIISPTSMLEEYSTDFHLVLTQYYLRDSKYREFYNKRRRDGDFVILDNGAAELKRAVSVDFIEEVWNELRPNVVVAPDVIYDKSGTINWTTHFLEEWSGVLHGLGIGIMAIPQGVPNEALLECFETFNNDDRIDWLGISKFYSPKFAGRLGVLTLIRELGVRKPCHLLGVWDNPYAVRQEGRFDFVRSIDTAKPIEFGLEGLTLAKWEEHQHLDDDWYMRVILHGECIETERLITRNIRRFISVFTRGI